MTDEHSRHTPRGGAGESAYASLANELRTQILSGQFGLEERLPTEAELERAYGVSRHTVRRAFIDLVAEGLVYRVPGRGTFVTPPDGRYVHHFGTVEEILALSTDTALEVVEPFRRTIDVAAAGRLRLDSDLVMTVVIRRIFDGVPFASTTIHVPEHIGRMLVESRQMPAVGVPTNMTVIGLIEGLTGRWATEADQSITVEVASDEVAAHIKVAHAEPVLRIDRLYLDPDGVPLELAVNRFHPGHYSYRVRLKRHGR